MSRVREGGEKAGELIGEVAWWTRGCVESAWVGVEMGEPAEIVCERRFVLLERSDEIVREANESSADNEVLDAGEEE
jgi:hypothetical protein